jgi:hypothetical protein
VSWNRTLPTSVGPAHARARTSCPSGPIPEDKLFDEEVDAGTLATKPTDSGCYIDSASNSENPAALCKGAKRPGDTLRSVR